MLITRSAGMPLFRAIARPHRVEEAISPVEWASGLMLNLQPSSMPRRSQRQSRSSRQGLPLTSTATPVLGASGQHALDVQVITRAAQQLPARHVTNDGDEWVGGCAHEAFGLRLPVEAKLPMNAADNKIEAAQHVFRVVDRAVRKDIGLDALEDAEAAAERRVEAVDLSLLLLDLLDREATGRNAPSSSDH